jgi:23S rRNA (guanosine2251-2'-O)-methyltransferase
MPESQIFFLECQNPACGLRFPLDLAQFEGKYCPRCGSPLTKDSPRLKSQSFSSNQNNPKKLIAILDNVRSAHNVGSIFRSADGAGFAQIHLCGITPTPDENPAIAKTALGAEKSLAWQYSPNAVQIIRVLKTQGVMILALETTPQALSLYELKSSAFPKDPAIALIVGNEPAGVDPKLIALADACLYIPMLGQKTSLNVSIAFSLAAYHLRFLY